jgi:hypothetical protein
MLGTYSNSPNLLRSEQCVACPLGNYCPRASVNPVPCLAGSYSDRLGTNSSACIPCPAGYHCPTQGMSSTVPCGTGYFSPTGQSTCSGYFKVLLVIRKYFSLGCTAGRFCSSNTTTSVQHNSNRCPAGMYCPAFTARVPELKDFACSKGKYCPQGTPTEQSCPPGYYNNVTGASSFSDCTICTAGYFCTGLSLSSLAHASLFLSFLPFFLTSLLPFLHSFISSFLFLA